MTDARRRAWECAYVLMEDHRDRLRPRGYGLCRTTLRRAPEAVCARRARRLHRLYAATVEPRA